MLVINNSVIGLMMTLVYADNPKGYVCRYRRCDTLQVPDTIEKFDSILTILASILNAKVRFMLLILCFIDKVNIFVNVSP